MQKEIGQKEAMHLYNGRFSMIDQGEYKMEIRKESISSVSRINPGIPIFKFTDKKGHEHFIIRKVGW